MQGIVAKPLVETLRLKKNRERNPKIRETQRFQEFENAVKVEIQLFVCGKSLDKQFQAESISSNFPSLSLTATWLVPPQTLKMTIKCSLTGWRSRAKRMRVVADPAGDLLSTASLPPCSPGEISFSIQSRFLCDRLLDRCVM